MKRYILNILKKIFIKNYDNHILNAKITDLKITMLSLYAKSLPSLKNPIENILKNTLENNSSYSLNFIIGAPRSGTTWLAREIYQHNQCDFFPECSYLTEIVNLFQLIHQEIDTVRFNTFFSTRENLIFYFKNILHFFLKNFLERNEKAIKNNFLLLKDPQLTFLLDSIPILFPDAKIISIIRDPRDILASMKNVYKRKKEFFDIKFISFKFMHYFNKIISHHEKSILLNDNKNIFVKYEDLILNGMTSIYDFISPAKISTSGTDFLETKKIHVNIEKNDPFFSELYLKETTSQKIGMYKNILKRSEISYIEKNLRNILNYWKY